MGKKDIYRSPDTKDMDDCVNNRHQQVISETKKSKQKILESELKETGAMPITEGNKDGFEDRLQALLDLTDLPE